MEEGTSSCSSNSPDRNSQRTFTLNQKMKTYKKEQSRKQTNFCHHQQELVASEASHFSMKSRSKELRVRISSSQMSAVMCIRGKKKIKSFFLKIESINSCTKDKKKELLGIMAQAFNLSTKEVETGRCLYVQDQLGLHSKLQTIHGYTERPCLKDR